MFGSKVREESLNDLFSTTLFVQPVDTTQFAALCAGVRNVGVSREFLQSQNF
jgi:hypothetical protein